MPLRATLERLKTEGLSEERIDAAIQDWCAAVDSLYDRIFDRFIAEYTGAKLLQGSRMGVSRTEIVAGVEKTYNITEVHLNAGPAVIILDPAGTFVIGARGRIDMYRRGFLWNKYMLIWDGEGNSESSWKISDKNREKFRPLTKESFDECLDELLKQA